MGAVAIEARVRRTLSAGLAFFVVTHVVALGAMALLLRNGMDPGAVDVRGRMAFVAQNATVWRLGWLPWQLSAASDLWVCIALLAWARRDASVRRIALAALALDVIGAVPEQWSEAMLVTSFVDLSRSGDADAWREAWALYAGITGVWANFAYTVMTACWMNVASRLTGRAVTWAWAETSLVLAFVVSGALTLAATLGTTDVDIARWFAAATVANGIAFPSLVLWTCALAWRVRSTAR